MRLPFRGVKAAASAPVPAEASVSAPMVAQRFNYDWAIHQEDFTDEDTYWWWAVDVRVDPNEIWAEDEEGNLWVVSFTTDGADEVTFGTPVRSRLTAVPVAAADGVAATAAVSRRRQRVLATNLERPAKPARETPAAASAGPDNERTPMDPVVLQALARTHGLDPETATEDDVNAAVIAAAQPEPSAPEVAPVAAPEAAPVAATSDRTVIVDRDRLAHLEDEAAAGAADRRSRLVAELDAEVSAAVADGRITSAGFEGWLAAIDPGENPDAASITRATSERAALAALTRGRVPVEERGGSPDTSAGAKDNDSLRRALAFSGLNGREAKGEVIRRG